MSGMFRLIIRGIRMYMEIFLRNCMGITLDLQARTVRRNGELIAIHGKEFDLLYELMKRPGEVISKEKLFNAVWGIDCFSEVATLNVHIRWLREKLEEDPKNPKLI
ncbi:MAG: winged helix-turn-helix transcriptional regulator [Lachnospiraceae bacterium]|nr:winged helix-turn-helix transcriptional regulator [Lachnospiraceae bacterium]